MKLYHSQGACSLAPHIALQEVGAKFSLEPVNLKTKTWRDGDYTKVNPKGQVPALQLDSGDLLTECAVTLQYIADLKPEAQLLPKAGTTERWKALEALNFVATEVHKGFGPLWNPATPPEFKEVTKQTLGKKFDYLAQRVAGGKFMLGSQYSVVDSYLFTVLNWSPVQGIDLSKWPELAGYMERVRNRPAVQAALKAEGLIK
ncbi:MAG TPA: glutathione transferase GstA [Oligoflexus sp.]|uniref:glutathione transferase GstA n=1 Tax=Oligoflexus sp. TaxID=1971216 RepID=UPI002D298647|nr:glutathione transferase GstA [Oligoflexus sp.]HYX34221.1 glutathione transferase GstA [Oligoflexus sp.]